MSKALQAKRQAFLLLDGWAWPTRKPTVSRNPPSKAEDTNVPTGEHVYLGQANVSVPTDRLTQGVNRGGWKEEHTIRVIIDVYQAGDNETACEDRADELYDAVIEAFGSNRSLSGTISQLGGWTSNRAMAPYAEGWRCQITVEQECTSVVPIS